MILLHIGFVATVSLIAAWIVPARRPKHTNHPTKSRQTVSIRHDLARLQTLREAWLSAKTFPAQITALSTFICNLDYAEYPQELEAKLKCTHETLVRKLTAIAEEYCSQLHEQAHSNRVAFHQLMLLLEGFSDTGRALRNAQVHVAYPTDWPELVALHIEDPSVVDFGRSIPPVEHLTEHTFARQVKIAIEEGNVIQALILRAYCKADPSKRAKLGHTHHAKLARVIEQSRRAQTVAPAA